MTASYAGSAVSGKVVVTNPGDAPAGACATATVEVYRLGAGGAQTLVGSRATAADGTYVVSGVTLPPGAQYLARALGSLDTARASCAAASSVTQTVPAAPVDRDGDGVPDATDLCPTVPGSASSPHPGCPVLARTITAKYTKAVLSGNVSSTATVPGSTTRPCAAAPQVTVWLLNAAGQPTTKLATGATSGTANAYSIKLPTTPAVGAKLVVKAEPNLVSGVASCAAATSPVVTATK